VQELHASHPADTVYLVKYRGYGGSTGQPSELAFYADAFGARAQFHVIAEAGHNNLSGYPEYHALLKQFLSEEQDKQNAVSGGL
jgi:hypothetical protein